MNKCIVLGVVFLFVLMSFTSISGNQINKQIVKTSDKGNILYVGGSGQGNFSRIQDAIDNASDGDTVFVFDDSSPYYEWNILINKSINLIGEDRDTTIIDGNNTSDYIILIDEDSVNISGFTIRNTSEGIISDSDPFDPKYLRICNNYLVNCENGMRLPSIRYSCVISNIFSDCDTSILSFDGYYTRISDNIVYSTPGETYYGYGEITCSGYGFSVIANNTVTNYNENGIGLYLKENNYNIIKNNTIFEQGCAIYMEIGSGNNFITRNNIINNGAGIAFFMHSRLNRIINNNFINNDDHYVSFPLNFNIYDGNYWDDWIGLKIPRLSFLPYFKILSVDLIPWCIILDWHPASEPYDYTTAQGCGII